MVDFDTVQSRLLKMFLRQICLLAGRGNSATVKGGWANVGRGEGIHGELGTRARRARSRHQPGDPDYGGERPPQGGKRGGYGHDRTPESPICAHSAEIRRRIGNSDRVAQCGDQDQPARALVRGVARARCSSWCNPPPSPSPPVSVLLCVDHRGLAPWRGPAAFYTFNPLTSLRPRIDITVY